MDQHVGDDNQKQEEKIDKDLDKTDNATKEDQINESNIQTENVEVKKDVVNADANNINQVTEDTNDEEVKEAINDEAVSEKVNEQAVKTAMINKHLRVYNDQTNANSTSRVEEKILMSLEEAENNLKIAKAIKSQKLTKAKDENNRAKTIISKFMGAVTALPDDARDTF